MLKYLYSDILKTENNNNKIKFPENFYYFHKYPNTNYASKIIKTINFCDVLNI